MPASVLFCPFCRESFEGITTCPEHELRLVTFDALPLDESVEPEPGRADEPVLLGSVGHGRGPLGAAAATLLLGFFVLPFVSTDLEGGLSATAFEVASRVAPNLWTIPVAALALVSVLVRRRTMTQMRGSRLAVMLIAFLPIASLAITLARIHRGAEELGLARGRAVRVHIEFGGWVLACAALAALLVGVRLGVRGKRGLPR